MKGEDSPKIELKFPISDFRPPQKKRPEERSFYGPYVVGESVDVGLQLWVKVRAGQVLVNRFLVVD